MHIDRNDIASRIGIRRGTIAALALVLMAGCGAPAGGPNGGQEPGAGAGGNGGGSAAGSGGTGQPTHPTTTGSTGSQSADGGMPTAGASSIRALRANPPPDGSIVNLKEVVVVGRVATSVGGEIWVQDRGGGPGSGILLFCDYTGAVRSCLYTAPTWRQFMRGQVVNVVGSFKKHLSKGAASTVTELRLDKPNITATGETAAPVASPVMAADVAKTQLGSDSLRGTYVSVAGPIVASSVMPTEFMTACPRADAGATGNNVVGFEAKAQNALLAIGLNMFETLSFCLRDTCTGSRPCTKPIATQMMFGRVEGVVEAHLSGDGQEAFLRLSPTEDGDLGP